MPRIKPKTKIYKMQKVQSRGKSIKMTPFSFKVVPCRIRLFPTMILALKWLGTGLPLKIISEKWRWKESESGSEISFKTSIRSGYRYTNKITWSSWLRIWKFHWRWRTRSYRTQWFAQVSTFLKKGTILKTYIFSKYYTPSPEGRRTRTAQGRTKNDKKKIVIIDPVERCYRPRVSEYDKALIRTKKYFA